MLGNSANTLSSPLAGDIRTLVQTKSLLLVVLPMDPIFSYSFSALQLFSCIILWFLSLQLLSSLSSHSFLSANAGATCDTPVAVSAVNIPKDSATKVNTFLVFKVCYRKVILNKV